MWTKPWWMKKQQVNGDIVPLFELVDIKKLLQATLRPNRIDTLLLNETPNIIGENKLDITRMESSVSGKVKKPTSRAYLDVLEHSTIETKNQSTDPLFNNSIKGFIRWKLITLILGIVCIILLFIGGIFLLFQSADKGKVYVVRSKKEFEELKNSVQYIQFPSNSCNEISFSHLEFSRFSNLKTIVVEDNCFKHVKKVYITNMNSLEQVRVGRNSFRSQENPSISVSIENREFVLKNCVSLNTVNIGPYSFSEFNSFSIDSLTVVLY